MKKKYLSILLAAVTITAAMSVYAAPSISTDVNPTTQVMVIASSALFRISKNFFIPSSTFH